MFIALTNTEIKALTESDPAKAAEYIKLLQGRLNLNSLNSGLPSSTDRFINRVKNGREKSGKKPGGQPGHKGKTLSIKKVDHTTDIRPEACLKCGAKLDGLDTIGFTCRYVTDLDDNFKKTVTCYKSLSISCPGCSAISKGVFPKTVRAWTQYGEKLQGIVTYFSSYFLISVSRLQEGMLEIFKIKISQATLLTLLKKTSDNLGAFIETIRKQLINSDVVHFDETSLRVGSEKRWAHVASTRFLTLISATKTRGLASMRACGVLPDFKGTAIHDAMAAYFSDEFNFSHGLCNVHHLRELKFVDEEMSQRWAKSLRLLLLEIKKSVDEATLNNKTSLDEKLRWAYENRYNELLAMGLRHPKNKIKYDPPARGRTRQSKSKNLLDRLGNVDGVLAFMRDFSIPFSNNLAESDIRMSKIKQKVSGCFRSDAGMDVFCRVRSYIGTLRKNGVDILQALVDAAMGKPFIPLAT